MIPSFRNAVAALIVAAIAAPALAGSMSDRHKKWLEEEVRFLLNKDEEKAFKDLKNDEEREHFVEVFWVRRDPTPLTPANEFKDEYYKRLEFVRSDKFPRGRGGLKSELARAFLLLGQPEKQEQDGRTLTWLYPAMPKYGSTHPMRFEFHAEGGLLEISSGESDGIPALTKVPATLILHPELTEVPSYPHMMDKAMIAMIDGMVEGAALREEIPCDVSLRFQKSQGGATYVSILAAMKDASEKAPKTSMFGRCKREEAVQEFNEPMEMLPGGATPVMCGGLALMPGEYQLNLGVMNKDSGKTTLRKLTVAVPNLDTGTLAMSAPVTSDQIEAATGESGAGAVSPFKFGRYRLAPKLDPTFAKTSSIFIFYQVYNAGVENGEARIKVEYVFNKDGQYFNRIPPEENRQQAANVAAVVMGTEVPLSTFPAGKYTVTVKLTDEVTKAQTSSETAFEIR